MAGGTYIAAGEPLGRSIEGTYTLSSALCVAERGRTPSTVVEEVKKRAAEQPFEQRQKRKWCKRAVRGDGKDAFERLALLLDGSDRHASSVTGEQIPPDIHNPVLLVPDDLPGQPQTQMRPPGLRLHARQKRM